MFVFDPTYAYVLVIVVPNYEIMIWQETYVLCHKMEMSLQESASNTVFINKECYCIKYQSEMIKKLAYLEFHLSASLVASKLGKIVC